MGLLLGIVFVFWGMMAHERKVPALTWGETSMEWYIPIIFGALFLFGWFIGA